MRRNRRGGGSGLEFGGSGEDSFVAVVVTKLTGALLFILLLTMVIMALLPKAVDLAPPGVATPGREPTPSPFRCRSPRPRRYPKQSPGVLTPLPWRPPEAAGRCTGTSRDPCRRG